MCACAASILHVCVLLLLPQLALQVWGYFSVKSGGGIHEYSDSQFGHLFARGPDRNSALRAMGVALRELRIRCVFSWWLQTLALHGDAALHWRCAALCAGYCAALALCCAGAAALSVLRCGLGRAGSRAHLPIHLFHI